MFRLEKVLQNDDSAYIFFTQLIKTLGIFISFYIFTILENNSIYELGNTKIFLNSKYFHFSISLSLLYLFISLFFTNTKTYKYNFISFLKEDVAVILVSNFLIFTLYFFINKSFEVEIGFFYSIIFLIVNLFIVKKLFNFIYTYMINNNIIHKNIMLVGSLTDIKFFLKNHINIL